MPLLNEHKSEDEKSFALRWYEVRNRVKNEFGQRPELFSSEGYFNFIGNDEEGWPEYEVVENIPKLVLKEQDELLKKKIVEYFETL